MVGVEAHGLLAVLTCTVPARGPEVWVAEVEALGSRELLASSLRILRRNQH